MEDREKDRERERGREREREKDGCIKEMEQKDREIMALRGFPSP